MRRACGRTLSLRTALLLDADSGARLRVDPPAFPGRVIILEVEEVGLPRPRLREDADIAALARKLSLLLE